MLIHEYNNIYHARWNKSNVWAKPHKYFYWSAAMYDSVKEYESFNFVPKCRGGSFVFYSRHFQMLGHTPTPHPYTFRPVPYNAFILNTACFASFTLPLHFSHQQNGICKLRSWKQKMHFSYWLRLTPHISQRKLLPFNCQGMNYLKKAESTKREMLVH